MYSAIYDRRVKNLTYLVDWFNMYFIGDTVVYNPITNYQSKAWELNI